MKMEADVDSLLMLRRQSERIALDDVIRQDSRLRKAERGAAEADHAVTQHLVASRAAERGLTGSLVGQAVSANAIARLQMEFDSIQAQRDHLNSLATAAHGSVSESKTARDAASEHFRQRQRNVARLELLARHMKNRYGRRRRAIDEALEEDLAARLASSSTERG